MTTDPSLIGYRIGRDEISADSSNMFWSTGATVWDAGVLGLMIDKEEHGFQLLFQWMWRGCIPTRKSWASPRTSVTCMFIVVFFVLFARFYQKRTGVEESKQSIRTWWIDLMTEALATHPRYTIIDHMMLQYAYGMSMTERRSDKNNIDFKQRQ